MNLFRTCPTTGLQVHRTADRLIQANAVAATVALLIGGIAAVLVLLTRWEAVLLLDAAMFYRMLTVHGMNMLIFFIIFFEMAVLYFASAVLLNCRVPAPRTGWIAFALMVGGALMVEWTMWTGRADVLFTSYVPLRAHPLFLSRGDPVRGRRPHRGRTLLRHPDRGEAREGVRRVDAAGHLRGAHGGRDRRGHAAPRGDHLHPPPSSGRSA